MEGKHSFNSQVTAAPGLQVASMSTTLLAYRQAPEKSDKEITSEIQAIIRQITASVTFLPLLNDACELLTYTH